MNIPVALPGVILVFLFCIGMHVGGKAQQTQGKGSSPNIILIQTDMQRFDALGAYGNPYIKTPNLDALAKSGAYFTNAYVTSPVCAPGRWSLFSGMYTTSHQAYSNQHQDQGIELPTSLPLELKKQGYVNALMGKNHSFLSKKEFHVMHDTPENGYDFKVKRLAPHAAPWPPEKDPTTLITDQTLQFIEQQKTDQPYFIWLSYLNPHTPYKVPEPYFSMYEDQCFPPLQREEGGLKTAGKPFRQIFHQENNDRLLPFDGEKTNLMRQTYYGMITLVDEQVGRILDYLRQSGQRENTIIIFTSDHGDYQGDHYMYTKSPAMYDCLIRVPLIFSWDGWIQPAKPDNALVSHVDVMPTLLSLVGVEIPRQVQGLDLSGKLKTGQWEEEIREIVFAEYGIPGTSFNRQRLKEIFPDYERRPLHWGQGIPYEANPVSLAGRFRMARTLRWKYVEYEDGQHEFYDLQSDPHELINMYSVAKKNPALRNLRKKLGAWKKNLPGIERDEEDLVPAFIAFYKSEKYDKE